MFRLAFYKSENGTFTDKLIAWWTRPNFWKFWDYKSYSHVEMYFSTGECFSSSPRDKGTRWKVIENIETSGNWDFIEISNIDEDTLRALCTRQEGKGYDWFCIFFNFIIPLDVEDPNKWTCSELCGKLIYKLKRAFRFSPNKLYKYSS